MARRESVRYVCQGCGRTKMRGRPEKIKLPRVWRTTCHSAECGGLKREHRPALRPLSGDYRDDA